MRNCRLGVRLKGSMREIIGQHARNDKRQYIGVFLMDENKAAMPKRRITALFCALGALAVAVSTLLISMDYYFVDCGCSTWRRAEYGFTETEQIAYVVSVIAFYASVGLIIAVPVLLVSIIASVLIRRLRKGRHNKHDNDL